VIVSEKKDDVILFKRLTYDANSKLWTDQSLNDLDALLNHLEQNVGIEPVKGRPKKSPGAPKGVIIDFCISPDRAEDVQYNLAEAYDRWEAKHGPKIAGWIFFTQSLGAVLSFWADWALRYIKLIKVFVSSSSAGG
jgi:hypothetical protein